MTILQWNGGYPNVCEPQRRLFSRQATQMRYKHISAEDSVN